MEPEWTTPPPLRPVWVGPAIFAAIGIAVVVLIAVVHRHDGHDRVAATTTTSAPETTSTSRPVTGPLGGPGNPIPVGSAGAIGGWTITVLAPSDADGAVQAGVRLEWDGTSSRTIGDAGELSLVVTDPDGIEHGLGGPACAGDPAGELAGVPGLDIGTSDTLALCWTVPATDLELSMLVVRSSSEPGSLSLALA